MNDNTTRTGYTVYGRMCDTVYTPDICTTFNEALKLRQEQIKEYCSMNELDLPEDIDSTDTTVSVDGGYAYAEWNIDHVEIPYDDSAETIELFDADEVCPHCGYGVIIMDWISRCPSCGKWIVACSMCSSHPNKCGDCPYFKAASLLNSKEEDGFGNIKDWFRPDVKRIYTDKEKE